MTRSELKISADLSLSLEAVTNTHLILARRRVGKTYTGSVMAEEFVKAGLPWVALDPTGAWWGLTSSADGKHEGLPVIVIGGPHGHIPLDPSAGKVIANLVVDNPGWYIIDFSRFDHRGDEIRFSKDFGVQLYRRKQRKPSALHLFIDEADIVLPQKLSKGEKEMFDAYDVITRRGGLYGLGITLICQRNALINKDITTQCETLIALQTSAPEDQDPIFNWVSRNGTKEQVQQIKQTLASLKKGQAWYFSSNTDTFKLIQIRERETFNSSATPKPGTKPIEPKVFANIDIAKLGEEISATVERSKQEDPEYLRQQIVQLKRELAAKPKETAAVETKIERVNVPVFSDEQYEALRKSLADVAAHAKDIKTVAESIDSYPLKIGEALEMLKKTTDDVSKSQLHGLPESVKAPLYVGVDRARGTDKTMVAVARKIDDRIRVESVDEIPQGDDVTGPMQRILDAIAWLESIGIDAPNVSTVAFLAGYTNFRSKGFTNPLSALSVRALINKPNGKTLVLTDLGRSIANYPQAPQTTDELQRVIFSKLPGPQTKILTVLVEQQRPYPIHKEELAARCGYTNARSKGFTNPLSSLKTWGFVEKQGSDHFQATNILFLE